MSEYSLLLSRAVLIQLGRSENEEELARGPVKELVFSDSEEDEEEDDNLNDDDEALPKGQHNFDLDDAPPSDDDEEDLEMGDEFDMDEDEFGSEEEAEEDSAFASSGDEDADMAGDENLQVDEDEEDGIQTNLEDDLEETYTLPAVDNGGEEEEHEHGTSLREVENRMRWLVGVVLNKEEKVSKGVPGKYVKCLLTHSAPNIH